jgi:RNA 2',3'-cyclic 3'-phosphodiesterase
VTDDDQPYLEGFAPEPRRSVVETRDAYNVFFALRPEQVAAEQAMAEACRLKRENRLSERPLKPENLHVTLFPFWKGNLVPADLAEVASGYAQAIRGGAFEVVFDMAMSFRRKQGFCLVLGSMRGGAAIYALQRQFVGRFQSRIRAASLTPHMTLLYPGKFVDKQPVEPIRWTAHEFVLIQSFVGQGRQRVIARWPLR